MYFYFSVNLTTYADNMYMVYFLYVKKEHQPGYTQDIFPTFNCGYDSYTLEIQRERSCCTCVVLSLV